MTLHGARGAFGINHGYESSVMTAAKNSSKTIFRRRDRSGFGRERPRNRASRQHCQALPSKPTAKPAEGRPLRFAESEQGTGMTGPCRLGCLLLEPWRMRIKTENPRCCCFGSTSRLYLKYWKPPQPTSRSPGLRLVLCEACACVRLRWRPGTAAGNFPACK